MKKSLQPLLQEEACGENSLPMALEGGVFCFVLFFFRAHPLSFKKSFAVIFLLLVEQRVSTGCIFQGWAGCFWGGNIVCSWKTEQQFGLKDKTSRPLNPLLMARRDLSPKSQGSSAMPGNTPMPALLPGRTRKCRRTKLLFSSMRGSPQDKH